MSRAHGKPLKKFKVFLYIFNYYFKKLSGTGKNYAYCKCEQDCFCKLTIHQPIWHNRQAYCGLALFFHQTYKIRTFLLGREIADSHRLMDRAVSLLQRPLSNGIPLFGRSNLVRLSL